MFKKAYIAILPVSRPLPIGHILGITMEIQENGSEKVVATKEITCRGRVEFDQKLNEALAKSTERGLKPEIISGSTSYYHTILDMFHKDPGGCVEFLKKSEHPKIAREKEAEQNQGDDLPF